MARRPNWKGYLKLSLVSCSIALYPASSASERVSFNQINKNTGNRIRYKKVDAEAEEEVESCQTNSPCPANIARAPACRMALSAVSAEAKVIG